MLASVDSPFTVAAMRFASRVGMFLWLASPTIAVFSPSRDTQRYPRKTIINALGAVAGGTITGIVRDTARLTFHPRSGMSKLQLVPAHIAPARTPRVVSQSSGSTRAAMWSLRESSAMHL